MELLQHRDELRKSGSVFGSWASSWIDSERTKAQQRKSKDKRRQARSYQSNSTVWSRGASRTGSI